MTRGTIRLSLSLAALVATAVARAAPAGAAAKEATGAAPASALRAAEAKLAGTDPAAIAQALDTLGSLGGEAAATAVSARLHQGLPPQLVEPAIAVLVRVGRPSAAPALLELTLHRRPRIRELAIAALGAVEVRAAQSALLYALDDPSPDVRAAAVRALAKVGTRRALPALFLVADGRVQGAFETIGAIAGPNDLKSLLQRAPNGDVTLVEPALRAMLDRPTFPPEAKLRIVREVGALGSPSARRYLVEWLDAHKQSGDARLKRALFDEIARIDRAAKTPVPAAPASGAAP